MCVTCNFSPSHDLLNGAVLELPNIYIALDIIDNPRSYLKSIGRLHANTSLFYFLFLWHMVSCSPWLETWYVAEADLELLVLLPYYYRIWHLIIFHKWLEPDWIWEPREFCNRSLIDTEGQLYYRCRQDSVCSISHTIRRNQTASLCNITLCTWRVDFLFDLAEYLMQQLGLCFYLETVLEAFVLWVT